MNIKPIRTKKDLGVALARIDALIDAKPGTTDYDELEVLATLVEVFEEKIVRLLLPTRWKPSDSGWINWV